MGAPKNTRARHTRRRYIAPPTKLSQCSGRSFKSKTDSKTQGVQPNHKPYKPQRLAAAHTCSKLPPLLLPHPSYPSYHASPQKLGLQQTDLAQRRGQERHFGPLPLLRSRRKPVIEVIVQVVLVVVEKVVSSPSTQHVLRPSTGTRPPSLRLRQAGRFPSGGGGDRGGGGCPLC